MSYRIIQLGYVTTVDRFDDAVRCWETMVGVGPFFIGDVSFVDPMYNGMPSDIKIRAAIAYHGDRQIEVVAQTTDAPSHYRDWINQHSDLPLSGLFHHYFFDTPDMAETCDRFRQRGATVAFRSTMPEGGHLLYLDTRSTLGCYLELTDRLSAWQPMFDIMLGASKAWDGITRYALPFDGVLNKLRIDEETP